MSALQVQIWPHGPVQQGDNLNRLGWLVHAEDPWCALWKKLCSSLPYGFLGKAIGQDFQPVAAFDDFQDVAGGLSRPKAQLVLLELR